MREIRSEAFFCLKIVAIFCFPLDLELTSFGTLSKLVKTGHQVHVAVVGNSIKAWTRKYKRLLYGSCKILHIDNILFTDRFDYSSVTQDNALVLNSIIRQVIPELVIIPSQKSNNHKHNVLSKTSLIACRGIGNILMYDFSNNAKFSPNICVTLSRLDASIKLDRLLEYWPLFDRKYFRSLTLFSQKTSILQKGDEGASLKENIRLQLAWFLHQKIYNQGQFLLDNTNSNRSGHRNKVSARINSGTEVNKQVRNLTFSHVGELPEIFESHRVLLV